MFSRFLNHKNVLAVFTAVAAFAVMSYADGGRYKDRLFAVEKAKDVSYAKDVPHLSSLHSLSETLVEEVGQYVYFYTNEKDVELKPLLMDLYTPKGDSEKKRAAVIVSHGGAMVAGAKDDTDQQTVTYCDSLAARGFVVASIEYRMGVTLEGSGLTYSIDSADFARSVYRGVQDINAAVRYMRKNADNLGIDPNRIYLVGNSAGAILSLENVYSAKESDFPTYIQKNGAPDLGSLNVYGEQGVDSHANGVVALWGAIHNPNIIGENRTPVFLVHGTDDETVLFKTGRPLANASSMIVNMLPNSMALLASLLKLDIGTPTLYGSFVIDSVLKAKNIEHETYFVEKAYHEFYDEPEYEKPVRTKAFDFLYKLATSESKSSIGKHAMLARSSVVQMQNGNRSFTVSRGMGLKFNVVDLRGRPVKSGNVSAGESVDLGALKNGVYVLRVQGERAIRFGLSQ